MAEELHGLYETMLPSLPRPACRLVASGNAVRSSPALCRALEELFGMELSMPAMTEEASFGAALAALVYTGRLDRQAAAGLIRYTR